MINLGTLEEIKDLRSVWKHESGDFTPWLAMEENIAKLGEALGLEIEVDERESSVGDFSVDILATEPNTGKKIIIENQLEETNHDHLGKLITYASGKSANYIIWLVKRARDEHRSAIEWLNKHTDGDINFFLCEIKLYRIGNSEPALKFEVVERPNDWATITKLSDKNLTPSQCFRYEYWSAFLDYAFQNKDFSNEFNRTKASKEFFIDLGVGIPKTWLELTVQTSKNTVGVEMRIHENKKLYKIWESKKETIESELGMKLDWREMPDNKVSRIIIFKEVNLDNKADWKNQFKWFMEVCTKFKKIFKQNM